MVSSVDHAHSSFLVTREKIKGLLVNRSYSNWSKIGNALGNHSSLLYHLDCVQYTDILKNSIDNPASRIDVMANSDIQMRMDENRHIIRQIVCAILFLGKQGLPFRGDNEDLNITKNPGNFLALLCFSKSDSILFDHVNHQGPRMPLIFPKDLRMRSSMLLAMT